VCVGGGGLGALNLMKYLTEAVMNGKEYKKVSLTMYQQYKFRGTFLGGRRHSLPRGVVIYVALQFHFHCLQK